MHPLFQLSLLITYAIVTTCLQNSYTNNLWLNPSYKLSWKVANDEIFFAFEVNTTGWIGFGIAEVTSGSMQGSDIVTAYVDSQGNTILEDRYTTKRSMPDIDTCADWILVSGEEVQGKTIVEVKRKLDTNDTQDRPILPGVSRIIWAFGDSDTIGYHGQSSATHAPLAIKLYGDVMNTSDADPDSFYFNISTNNAKLNPIVTDYQCAFYPLPVNDSIDYSLVEFEAFIDPQAIEYLHHFVLYFCDTDDISWYNPQMSFPRSCGQVKNSTNCPDVVAWGWGPGVTAFQLPKDVGFRVGPSAGAFKMLYLQIHYHNPALSNNSYDNSIIQMKFTPNLRTYDAGVVTLGDPRLSAPDILGNQTFVHLEMSCDSSCTNALPYEVTFFSHMLHMHEIGSQMYTTHWRGNEYLGVTSRIDFWDFNHQQITPINGTIKPGDRFNIHCIFNSASRPGVTKIGYGSKDEMCIDFVFYYPRIPAWRHCGYYRNKTLPMNNHTLCNDIISDLPNPVISDPDMTAIIFGTDSNSGTCPQDFTTTAPATTSATTAAVSAATTFGSGGSTGQILAIFTISFLHFFFN